MATDTLRYPLDTTGVSEINKVVGELHPLVTGQVLRVVAPKFGAFYKAGLVVVDSANGTPLTPGVQYYVAYRYDVPTERFKQDVCALIVITDSNISAVFVNYQAVGEDFSWSAQHVADMLNRRVSNDRSPEWARLLEPVENTPVEGLRYYEGTLSTSNQAVMAINRLAAAKMENDPLYMQQLKDYVAFHANKIGEDAGNSVDAQITEHIADSSAHGQYARIADINNAVPMVKRPVNISPIDGALNVNRLSFTMMVGGYYGLYEIPQNAAQFQVAKDVAFTDVVYDNLFPVATVTGQFNGSLELNTRYYWRARQRNAETVWSDWSLPTGFTSNASGVATPAMTSPANDQVNVGEKPTLTTNNFAMIGGSDTHISTDWVVTTGPDGLGTVVWSSLNNTVNKTSIAIPAGVLDIDTKYYVRARHNSASFGPSGWAESVAFTTAPVFIPVDVGASYGGGFFAGTITRNSKDYAIIVAPKSSEQTLALQTVTTQINAYDQLDSKANTDVFFAATNSPAANFVRGMTYGGYSDWQIPAKGVMDVLYQNIRPGIASLPAAFKTGGSEALTASSYYWTSTAYDWVRDASYTEQGQPIYGQIPYSQHYSNHGPAGLWGTCTGSLSPANVDRTPTYVSNGTQYEQVEWDCVGTTTGVVGYGPGTHHEVFVNMYEAYSRQMAENASAIFEAKTTQRQVRAVRLIDIATIGEAPTIGAPYGGGFYVGRMMENGILYDLIVAPKALGEASVKYAMSDISAGFARSLFDGAANTAALAADNQPSGVFAKGKSINGFTDWYLPARDELELIYRNLKPFNTANSTFERPKHVSTDPVEFMGQNQYSRPVGLAYTETFPAKTTVPGFFDIGGAETFDGIYGSSTEVNAGGQYWRMTISTGQQSLTFKSLASLFRLVRKVKVLNPPAEIPAGIAGEPFAGGYYAGQYNDGFCNYALVVAPKARGEFSDVIGDFTAVNTLTSYIDGQANTSLIYANSPAGVKVKSLSIAGYTDWYIPSFYEMEIIYRNLKPTTDANSDVSQTLTDGSGSISAGTNKYSIPSGLPYTPTDPVQTANALFKTGGSEALTGYYATSTYARYDPSTESQLAWIKTMSGPASTWNSTSGVAWQQPVTSNYNKRAVRRVALSQPVVQTPAVQVPSEPGTAFAGGTYVGRMIVNGETYALVAAPKAGGEKALAWKTTNTVDTNAFGDLIDGWKNTIQYQDAAHPAALWARSLNLSGCNDWYLPSRDELEMMYRYLKPNTLTNYTVLDRVDLVNGTVKSENAHGTNNNSVPTGTRYLVGNPAQVSNVKYQTNGAEALFSVAMSSSTVQMSILPLAPYVWCQFANGRQMAAGFGSATLWRAVRKVKIVD